MTTSSHSPFKLIAGIHVFAGLKNGTREALAAACRPLSLPKGALVVKEGSPGDTMFLLVKGKVDVVKGAGSRREVLLAQLEDGELFGEMCVIECRRRSASIRAVSPVELLTFKSGDLLRVFQRWPDEYAVLIFNIARHLCRRLRRMDEVFAATHL